jgi:hypothetical protein
MGMLDYLDDLCAETRFIVIWPGITDQPLIANQMANEKIGIELMQIRREAHSHLGSKTSSGVLIEGTTEALRRELNEVFTDMFSDRGTELKANVLAMKEIFAADRYEGGRAYNELQAFEAFCMKQ